MVVERINLAGARTPAETDIVSASRTVMSPSASALYETALFWLLKAPNRAAIALDWVPVPRRLGIETCSRSGAGGSSWKPCSVTRTSGPPTLLEGQMGSSKERRQPLFSRKSRTAAFSDRNPAVFT